MLQIRYCVFETNSSSSHYLVLMTNSKYAQWENGEIFLKSWYSGEFITKEEAIEKLLAYENISLYIDDAKLESLKRGTLSDEEVSELIYAILDYYPKNKVDDNPYTELIVDSLDGVTAISYYSQD